jgi:NAD(P)-dependent dehydrogenase (short-subunit alcohol dehydrogenase family)
MWTTAEIPSQVERRAVVTGTGGLGFEIALALAGAGADVIVAGRNAGKGYEAVAAIRDRHPNAQARFEFLDLASLASVAGFADRMAADGQSIDLLVNNAGVLGAGERRTTADGFEQQFGTNHLGHFALTGRLLPLLRRGDHPRVVSMSSGVHLVGRLDFDDLQSERRYRPNPAYAASKLANLMFTFELQRRSDAAGWRVFAAAAHPGYARTELLANGPGTSGLSGFVGGLFVASGLSQSAADGAWPALFAATAPEAAPGGYYGPGGLMEMRGPPAPARVGRHVRDAAVARRLWEVSETLTGVVFGQI